VLTGLAHDNQSHVAYESAINQQAMAMRSRKLAVLKKTLKVPEIHGDPEGDLLVVSWGSTLGAVEEAVDRIRDDGGRVSSLHLRFLCPLPPGLKAVFQRFNRVMTVEINYSDDIEDVDVDPGSRRRAQLCRHLRSKLIMDIGCWSRVPGSPLPPGVIEAVLRRRLDIQEQGAQ
jgi:2-oxoglutarate ferredoxin oxidoreductase subunit alpha